MKVIKMISKVFLASFMGLIMFLIFSRSTTIDAVSSDAVNTAANVMAKYDGITNWKLQRSTPANQIGEIPIGDNVSLGYTFGSARNANGKVTAGDKTITLTSTTDNVRLGTNTTAPSINNSKINIFLNNNGTYYGILHQGESSYIGTGGHPERASDTSIDFALISGLQESYFYKDMNVLANLEAFASSNKESKLFYTGTDENNRPVYKLVGYFGKKSIFVQIVLRPDPSGSPIVWRELYVYNPNGNAQYQTFYGEDTGLNPNNNLIDTVDNVPMFAIGDKKGLYLESGSEYTPASKLLITNDVDGGFKDFMGRTLTNPGNWSVKGRSGSGSASPITNPSLPWSSSPNDTQNGDTNALPGKDLLHLDNGFDVVDSDGKQDSAYTLRWPQTSSTPGKVEKFVSKIGAAIAGYAIPTMKLTYQNLTSSDGTNQVNDKLQFDIYVQDDGYQSSWVIKRILDALPAGLTFVSSADIPTPSGNLIDYDPNSTIDGKTAYKLTFIAKIDNTAPYNLDTNGNLTNKANVSGHNAGQTDTMTLTDSVKIPVQIPKFKYRFTELLRNETTDPNGVFTNRVIAQKDDIIDFKVDFISNGSSIVSNSYFYNKFEANDGLELVPNSVSWNGSSYNTMDVPMGALRNNQTYTVTFKAKVTGVTKRVTENSADLLYALDGNTALTTRMDVEQPAIVDIQDPPQTTAITEVPSKIDFGTVNSANLERLLTNISTTGNLRITHVADTAFQVGVAYDNDGDNAIAGADNKLVQDGSTVLLFNQSKNDEDLWKPLGRESLPIDSDGFSGSYQDLDLSKYIGINKWKLRVPANSKAGQYNGQITWSITDTL
ncbi:isopeptide-forming domain-containing fimbrial protein [Companilactobacillus insicii]|uniref:isopeptide-forming domain-containing fimbrial protein n=1 Tax=Companilactobacillus insicii TaxID=1732567 RepID=UPI000F7AC5E3|nr:isopeptide-forming domain-containing fimbrial protein [Companilactobacillus insicii]